MDYLKTVSDLAQFRPKENTRERTELAARTADTKARIYLYGSSGAIRTFSRFQELGATMESEDQLQALTEMVLVMRADSGGEHGV